MTEHVKQLIMEDCDLSSAACHVLLLLATYANDQTGVTWPKHSKIERLTHLSRSTVKRAIAQLLQFGFITEKQERYEDNRQTSNAYRLVIPNAQIAKAPVVEEPEPEQAGGSHRTPWGPQGTPSGSHRPPSGSRWTTENSQGIDIEEKPLPTTEIANDTTPSSPGMTNLGDDSEVARAMQFAERRRATRDAGSLLSQQHPIVWAAFADLQSIYTWKPTAFATIAEQILTLTRHHTDTRTERAIRTVIEAGATITHPIPYIRKLLTTNDTQPGTTTQPRRSLRDGLTPLDSFTLD
jgi:hypothetical protein